MKSIVVQVASVTVPICLILVLHYPINVPILKIEKELAKKSFLFSSEMTLVMGSAVDFSTIDLAKINQMYSCSMRTRSMFSQPDLIDAHLIAMDTRRSVASTQLLSESRRGWVALCKRSFGHQRQGEVEEGKGFDKEKVQKREKCRGTFRLNRIQGCKGCRERMK